MKRQYDNIYRHLRYRNNDCGQVYRNCSGNCGKTDAISNSTKYYK